HGCHAALLREEEAEPPEGLPDGVPDLGLDLGPVRDVLLAHGLVGDLRRADVGDYPDGGVLWDVVAPPVYLLVQHLERDVVALVVEQRDAVREPEELPPRLEELPSIDQPDLDQEW